MQEILQEIYNICSKPDCIYMALSFAFAVCIIFLGEFFYFFCKWSQENTRKFIHIGVCHWWPIASYTIDSLHFAIIPPILFTILNCLSYRFQLVKSMERKQDKADFGTVYYALVLLLLVLITWHDENLRYWATIGVLILGYGDGLAAIVGKNFPYGRFSIWKNTKTLSGSVTMFFVSWIILFLFIKPLFPFSFFIIYFSFSLALIIAFIEALTPWGFDNITVPFFILAISFFNISSSDCTLAILIMLATCISIIAYKKKSLTKNAAIGAISIGFMIAITSKIVGVTSLLLFFISSSLWGRYKKLHKKEAEKKFEKTGTRDLHQVLANGIVGTVFSCLYFCTANDAYLYAVIVSFATANADTWATELGTLSKKKPFSLRNFTRVSRGTSGAVSSFGLFCSFLGSLCIVSISLGIIFFTTQKFSLFLFFLLTLLGFIGALLDSILGATIQCIYQNKNGELTEKMYENEQQNTHVSGIAWINNDIVNFISILLSSTLTIFLVFLW